MSASPRKEISRHGLTEVFQPSNDIKAVANIVFVHGLFGHPEKTWTGHAPSSKSRPYRPQSKNVGGPGSLKALNAEQDQPSNDIFWPSDLLSKVVPNTRIFTWGYDADIDGFWSSSSQNTVAQHATNLLADVTDLLEDDTYNLPVIFVVHSLGGIVVKAAVNQSAASRNARTKIMAPALHGIIFLGTPHRGSKSASIGKVAYQVTRAATRRPNRKLLGALERNSDVLDQVGCDFLHTLEEFQKIQIYSFHEEKETRKFWIFNTIVVEPDSAKIGFEKEELSSIPSNHRGMSKLSSANDIGFKRVSAQIKRWVRSIPAVSEDFVREKYADCILSLDSAATKARFKTVATSHAETLQWVFDSSIVSFSTWLGDDENVHGAIYWIQGLPGSGKSTLMKFAMNDLRAAELLQKSETIPYVIAGFFFHDRGSLIQKSTSGMLQELLHSTLVQAPELGEFMQPIYTRLVKGQRTKAPIWDFEGLKTAFEAIVMQRRVKARICLFLDALDEHHGDNEQLAIFLQSLASLADGDFVKIKLCIASRPWDIFTVSFGSCPGLKIHEHTSDDIRMYTLSRLNQASPKTVESPLAGNSRSERLETLARQVTKKAHGVFIWVRIVVDEIAKGVRERVPFFVLEEMLSNMPEELKDLYGHTLERIEVEHTEEAYVMLQIALCALSPLTLEAFVNATSFTLWKAEPKDEEVTEEDMRQRVISRSGGLLEVSQRMISFDDDIAQLPAGHAASNLLPAHQSEFIVEFLHQTVKEYIQTRKDNFGLRRDRLGGNGFQYLLDVGIRCWGSWADQLGMEIFEYARCYQFTEQYSQQVLESILLELLTPSGIDLGYTPPMSNAIELEIRALTGRPYPFEGPPNYRIHWWASNHVSDELSGTIYEFLEGKITVLSLALASGLFEVVRTFYPKEVSGPNNHNKTDVDFELMAMATIGPKKTSVQVPRREMLSLLFELGINPNCSGGYEINDAIAHATPLALLIDSLNIPGQDETERLSAIECLLEAGADPNGRSWTNSDSKTIFERCVKQENVKVVRLFGKHGANLPACEYLRYAYWNSLRRQSVVLMEVMEISIRNSLFAQRYLREISRNQNMSAEYEHALLFRQDKPVSALVVVGATTAICHGASWWFKRCMTAKERWRYALHRTMWLRGHRIVPKDRLLTFEDVVFAAMRSYIRSEKIF